MVDLPVNAFKAALQENRLQRGVWCTLRDPLAVEMIAGCGFDWMLFDTEHSPLDTADVLSLAQAVAPYPVSPIVRPASLNAAEIKKLLDIGMQSILVPLVENAAQAELAAASVTYPPDGIRGVSAVTRASRFGRVEGYARRAREQICLIVQIETAAALDNIEDIAGVPGIDAIFVGPADLAASMGHAGDPGHPEVRTAVLDAIRRIRKAGRPAGLMTMDSATHDGAIEAGATFISRDIDIAALRKGLTG